MAKLLAELVRGLPCEVSGNDKTPITGIAYNSKQVRPGNLFIAVKGFTDSGDTYIAEAIRLGAAAIASSQSSPGEPAAIVRVADPRRFLADVANRFYDFPSRDVTLVGVTGTNGKTTTTYILRAILEAAGERSGLIGTIRHFDGKDWVKALNTTPESLDIVQMLDRLRSLGIRFCVAEVSSHAIALDRVAGLEFRVGVFTNLTQDHLDFHKTMAEYKRAKLSFFQTLSPRAWAVYNADDPAGLEVRAATQAQKLAYTLDQDKTPAHEPRLQARVLGMTANGTELRLVFPDSATDAFTSLIGRHNAYNVAAAASAAHCLGIPVTAIAEGIRRLKTVPGRLERIENRAELSVFVDYAHSPDALKHLIETARSLVRDGHKVIVVFGCGGNRDRGKRPLMGGIATALADRVVITSDNPRDEDPQAIIDDVKAGVKRDNYEVVVNRYDAIKRALFIAAKGDIVLVAGKGHEDYQIIGKERRHFDDRETVRAVLGAR